MSSTLIMVAEPSLNEMMYNLYLYIKNMALVQKQIKKVYLGSTLVRPAKWVPPQTALAWYQFNGNLDDTLGNYNMTEWWSIVYSQWDLGNQAYFDSSSYWVSYSNLGRLGQDSITIAVTYKPENNWYIVAWWEYGSFALTNNMMFLRTQSTWVWGWGFNFTATSNQWHTLVCTYNWTNVIWYLDGTVIWSYSATGGMVSYRSWSDSVTLWCNRTSSSFTSTDKYNWYIHEVVIDSVWWDVTTVQDFTNYSLGN